MHDVVVVGAGLSGLTAAYYLRERDVVVLEGSSRAGGRVRSGGDVESWYNVGAQVVTGGRTADLCDELGLDLVDITDADYAMVYDGQLLRASNVGVLAARLPTSTLGRVKFASTALRLRRRVASAPREQDVLDASSLADVASPLSPESAAIFETFCAIATSTDLGSISGAIGLGYSLNTFLNPGAYEMSGVRGGTERLATALCDQIGPSRILLESRVTEICSEDDCVHVSYESEGELQRLVARDCICALPANAVLEVVKDLGEEKRAALTRVTPYRPLISIAWPLTDADPAPWDGLMMVPVVGSMSFNLFNNNSLYAVKSAEASGSSRRPGYLVTTASADHAERLVGVPDDEVIRSGLADLGRIFPGAEERIDVGAVGVHRWLGLPQFRPGYLGIKPALRDVVGRVRFVGDYTGQPGLNGATSSGRAVALALLEEQAAAVEDRRGQEAGR